jgi:hypothetical protein
MQLPIQSAPDDDFPVFSDAFAHWATVTSDLLDASLFA